MSDTLQEIDGLPSPAFRIEHGASGDTPKVHLYMQTFDRATTHTDSWVPGPAVDWYLLATIEQQLITTYPAYVNPFAQRYLRPKHGRITKIVFERDPRAALPETEEEAIAEVEAAQSWRLFDEHSRGLGFVKQLDPLCADLSALSPVNTIKIVSDGNPQRNGDTVVLPEAEVLSLLRTYERTRRQGRAQVRQINRSHVRYGLLPEIDPENFPRIAQVMPDGQLVQLQLDRSSRSRSSPRSERARTVRAVRDNIQQLANEAPRELLQLHAEIERVTLANMIGRYESMLQQSLSEGRWQKFFEDNIFILSMAFARPVRLLHTQFHAQGSSLDGSGAQIGDFLFAEEGATLAIVEIKRPSTELMLNTTYRNREVFGPSAELSGAVTQVLYQQSALRSHWLLHQSRPELRESRPDSIRCVIIAGNLPADEMKRRSFEIFRNACKDVDIVTFDELLRKLQMLLAHLTPANAQADPEPPF